MQETQFSVHRAQTEGFAKVWKTPGGIHLTHSPATIQFATDFANVVLRGFIDMCKHQAQEAAKAALPTIKEIAQNQGVTEQLAEQGLQIDNEAIDALEKELVGA